MLLDAQLRILFLTWNRPSLAHILLLMEDHRRAWRPPKISLLSVRYTPNLIKSEVKTSYPHYRTRDPAPWTVLVMATDVPPLLKLAFHFFTGLGPCLPNNLSTYGARRFHISRSEWDRVFSRLTVVPGLSFFLIDEQEGKWNSCIF